MISSYTSGWKRAFDYAGRATRSDFWWFVLVDVIISIVLNGLFFVLSLSDSSLAVVLGAIATFYAWAAWVARVPLAVRRMRDIGKGWVWILTIFTCILLPWFIYLAAQPSVVG